jgi:penicillin-binding protein 1C
MTLPVTSERTLPLKATGGTEPLTWLVNGRPLTTNARRWDTQWQPDGGGYHTVQVMDANGETDQAVVHIQPVRSGSP